MTNTPPLPTKKNSRGDHDHAYDHAHAHASALSTTSTRMPPVSIMPSSQMRMHAQLQLQLQMQMQMDASWNAEGAAAVQLATRAASAADAAHTAAVVPAHASSCCVADIDTDKQRNDTHNHHHKAKKSAKMAKNNGRKKNTCGPKSSSAHAPQQLQQLQPPQIQQPQQQPAPGRLLASDKDKDWLSPHLCVLRRSIEAFAATTHDIEARRKQGGTTRNPPKVGHVGIRCVHCKHLPLKRRVKAAEAYPSSIKNMHQCVRNFQRNHWPGCTFVPSDVRVSFNSVKSKHTQSKSKASEYWQESCADLGMVDLPDGRGIVFADGRDPTTETANSATTAADPTETETANSNLNSTAGDGDGDSAVVPDGTCSAGAAVPMGRPRTDTMDTLDEALTILAAAPAQLPNMCAAAATCTAGDDGEYVNVSVGDDLILNHSAYAEVQIAEVPAMSLEEARAAITAGKNEERLCKKFANSVDNDPNYRRQLLSTLVSVREVVRHLRRKHSEVTGVESDVASSGDLHTLGVALYQSLASESHSASNLEENDADVDADGNNIDNGSGNGNGERLQKRERRPIAPKLKDLGHPVGISIFCQSLIDATDEDAQERFATLTDVEDDVERMIAVPDKYVFGQASLSISSNGSGGGQMMNIPTTLYGRTVHQSMLLQAFQSVIGAGEESRGLALVSGRSGSGKTSLVEMTLVGPLLQRRGRIIRVKFDNNDQSMLAIFRAFNRYCQDLWDDPELLAAVGKSVKSALGPATTLLLAVMPSLYSIVGDVSFPSLAIMSNAERHNLLLHGFTTFVRTISAPSHPVVLFLDDLQWANAETLALISALVTDRSESCLFVCCYRSDEVVGDHILLDALGRLASSGTPMWQISVENIGSDDINDFLSDACLISPRLTLPLAREIYRKTQGSPMFMMQLVRSLCDENMLFYSPGEGRWQWNIAAIRSKAIPDDAVGLVLDRMSHYGLDVQRVLQIASLMGSCFTAAALTLFQAGSDDDVCGDSSAILNSIDRIVVDGLLCVDKGGQLRFAHDSIWEAALSLTPPSKREAMSLFVGRSLLAGCSRSHRPNDESLDVHLQLIVDQMNAGSALIESNEERLKLCELNMKAGKTALATESFLEASIYLLRGSLFIVDEDWNTPTSYDLCLELLTCSAEAQLALGRNEAAVNTSQSVLLHGKCLDDTLASNFVAFVGLYNQGKLQEALTLSCDVLGRLGVNLPSQTAQIEQSEIHQELQKTETMLSTIRVEDVTSRPISTDKKKIYTMLFLYALCKTSYVSWPDLMTIAIFRMMELIFSGETLTSESSFAFASYSNLLCTIGLRDRSARFARIAMSLVDKFDGKYQGEIVLSLSISIRPYRQPLQACLESLETAASDCRNVGDLNTAFLCAGFGAAIIHVFGSMETLSVAEKKLRESLKELVAHGHPMFIMPMIQLQGCLNLNTSQDDAAADDDPTMLQGLATDGKEIMSVLAESHPFFGRLNRKASFMRLFLGILFRRQDVVLEFAPSVKEHASSSKFYPSTELLLEKFYLGLAAYSIMRQGGSCDTEEYAESLTQEMKHLAENDSKWNFESKFFLLSAERAFTKGDLEEAASTFDKAIESAKQHRFIGEQALSCERAALFHLGHGDVILGRKYFEKSRDLYEGWGAKRKVEDIQSLLGEL